MNDPAPPAAPDWNEVNDLFHRALEEPPDRRGALLDRACAGRPELRAEVASLLDAHLRAGRFIEQPAVRSSMHRSDEASALDSLVGRSIRPYTIQGLIGHGGMGVVYRAEDTRLGRVVALKAIAPKFAGDEQKRERLRREARAAAALNHPGIATIYALEEIDGELYIASEYISGETLRREIQRARPSAQRAVEIGLEIARALAAAHERGIVHRDLKPENVMRSSIGHHVKILDFGLARLAGSGLEGLQLTSEGMRVGTPAYMAPEQIRGRSVDFRADVFAFGIMLHELGAGVHPFAGTDHVATIANILEAEPASGPDAAAGDQTEALAWNALQQIVRVCLQKQPEDRFQSTRDLVDALEAARRGLARPGAAVAPPRARRGAADRSALWWWQFHQAAASASYLAMLIPLGYARASDRDVPGLAVFLLGLVAALAASTLRLHLWFTVRAYPSEWASQRQRSAPWIRLSDIVFVLALVAAAGLIAADHARLATLLIGAAVASLVAFTIIEPATTRATEGDGGVFHRSW